MSRAESDWHLTNSWLFSFQGKIEMTLEVMPKTEANMKPAGQGRDDPNKNPTLEEPKYVSQ